MAPPSVFQTEVRLSRTRWLRLLVEFNGFVDQSYLWAPVGGVVGMLIAIGAICADAVVLLWLCAAALVALIACFFGLIASQCWLCGVIGFCRAWRDGFIGAGLIKLTLATSIGGVLAAAAVAAVLRFAAL